MKFFEDEARNAIERSASLEVIRRVAMFSNINFPASEAVKETGPAILEMLP